jgi:hypothetical protein
MSRHATFRITLASIREMLALDATAASIPWWIQCLAARAKKSYDRSDRFPLAGTLLAPVRLMAVSSSMWVGTSSLMCPEVTTGHPPVDGLDDEAAQRDPFLERQKPHFAGLARGKQCVRAMRQVPSDQPFQAVVADCAVMGERRQHDRNDTFDTKMTVCHGVTFSTGLFSASSVR